ncbi:unnamed protein product [Arctogadus glacialis]
MLRVHVLASSSSRSAPDEGVRLQDEQPAGPMATRAALYGLHDNLTNTASDVGGIVRQCRLLKETSYRHDDCSQLSIAMEASHRRDDQPPITRVTSY